MKQYFLILILLFSSCEITEVPRVPLLSTPLGLNVFTSTVGGLSMAIRFEAFNTEAFFSGFRIYITTTRADLENIDPNDRRFALAPTGGAVLLSNFTTPNDTNVTISFPGAMTEPSIFAYPQNATIIDNVLQAGGISQFGTTPFVTGTTYFIGVYAYSIGDNVYSIPNIASFTFP
ncbi:MAG: hypothetical protein ACRCY4_04755 [Brevinema sp.]